jgi:hypothetical protein
MTAPTPQERNLPGPREILKELRKQTPPAKVEYVLTEKTEVRLDDRPCRYEEVPASAAITLIELAADARTLLKIHFRTKK